MAGENKGSVAGFLEGIILGLVIGGALGVLLAPQSGEKSRAWLKKMKDDNQDIIDDAIVNSESLVISTKQSIEDGFKKVSKMIDDKMKKKI